jgi:ribosomal protein S18 acetylase RimI-like enzyme
VTTFVVREALPDELDGAGEVVVRAYTTLEAFSGGRPSAVVYLEQVRDARARARECPVLVAVDAGGRILGSVTYVPDHLSRFAELEAPGEAGFRMLGVAPESMGRGVGRALVEACIALACEAGRAGIAISTSPDMSAAHGLYERLGFRRAPARDFDPVPGVRLWAYVLAL